MRLVFICLFLSLTACHEKSENLPIVDSGRSDFALYDIERNFHRMSFINDSKAIVLFVQGNGCPIVRGLISDYESIAKQDKYNEFSFFYINGNPQDSVHLILDEAKKFRFSLPVLHDPDQIVIDQLDINTTAEVLVLHPTTREVLYRGALNNRMNYDKSNSNTGRNYLEEILNAINKKNEVPSIKSQVQGCVILRRNKVRPQKTFTDHIGELLINNCVKCHNLEGIAPWAMSSYEQVRGWGPMIKEVLISKRMPPWNVSPNSEPLLNDNTFSDSLRAVIINWVDSGMPKGKEEDPLKTNIISTQKWKMGEPSLVLKLDEELIPANGIIPYREQTYSLNNKQGIWVNNIEVRPGNPKVVHHIVLFNKTNSNDYIPIFKRTSRSWIDGFVATYGGFETLTRLGDSSAIFLPPNSEFKIQIHYTSYGVETVDKTEIGMYLKEVKPKQEIYSCSVGNFNFEIPPFSKRKQITAMEKVHEDLLIHWVGPHMHYRGRKMKVSHINKAQDTTVILDVPDYSFNWQHFYELKRPYLIKKGGYILVESEFDNSRQNPLNPDPSKTLNFGLQSEDEMMFCMFYYSKVQ